jgi:hypothetical protein
VISGFGRAAGNDGFARCVSPDLRPFPGIAAAPSIATISALSPGILRCNSAGVRAADENAVRSLSTDSPAVAAGESGASARRPLDSYADV